ncbi:MULTISPECIES: 2-dehydro-3-deoxy-D-gluconate 5-dehydrogenase KduD [unclassified Halomonas]|uniref:2-dehydro-3-deoxy-D-gluconate 5-dehydrogenase KduD n=1 Tax=unclassified Halomonas TaxID=2609666 RepID=UPI00209D51C2|nr:MULTISPECIES: 2-dehydro-3-deoxy-D-gluconate 5-dehydrogenase KduD [unclassified Halomonas]MCP1341596.1 2-dehydro-3-deoxy-D-gluconate 5-dehydrogenase KduD [Halomonas sp. FL8]MCP1360242.1 2-dehydro-3-deoxy-D-gluconate 5-dehydrogenase KduD [Halomonas sp. BBD45]
MPLFSLEGRVAMVTGCNRGLGQAMAVALAEAGADIVGVSRREADQTRQRVEALGRRYVSVEAELGKDRPADIVERAITQAGQIDILVNNAGMIRRAPALEFSEDDWDSVIDVNLKAAFFLAQHAARHMIERGTGGKIIHVASMLSFQGGIRVPSYTASKSGILGLTRLMANEWASQGVNVNAIAPGYMATDNTQALRDDPQRSAEILGRIPAGRWGNPDDLAGAAVFLASSASDYVHGHTLAVDGGWLAR